jgi:hypothetical protein
MPRAQRPPPPLPRFFSLSRAWLLLKAAAVAGALAAGAALAALPLLLLAPLLLPLLLLAEVAFVFVYRQKLGSLSVPHEAPPPDHNAEATFDAFIRTLGQLEAPAPFLRAWFLHDGPTPAAAGAAGAVMAAEAAEEPILRRGNVEELLCYAFWHRRRGKMLAAGHGAALARQVAALEAALGGPLPAGYNRRLRCARAARSSLARAAPCGDAASSAASDDALLR